MKSPSSQKTRSSCPVCTEKLGLLKHKLCCFVLEVGRGAVLSQDAFDQDFDLGSRALKARRLPRIRYGTKRPVDGDAFVDVVD